MYIKNIKVGDLVAVQTWDRGVVRGRVVDVDSNIKNGRPGIEYDIVGGEDDGEGHWCYLDQVLRHLKPRG